MKTLARIINFAIGMVVSQFVRRQVQRGSLQAARAYIKGIEVVRKGVMGVAGLAFVVACLPLGVTLFVAGLIGFFPISAETVPYILLVAGIVLSLGSFFVLYAVFDQKRWLEKSRAYDLLDAVTGHKSPLSAPLDRMEQAAARAASKAVQRVKPDVLRHDEEAAARERRRYELRPQEA